MPKKYRYRRSVSRGSYYGKKDSLIKAILALLSVLLVIALLVVGALVLVSRTQPIEVYHGKNKITSKTSFLIDDSPLVLTSSREDIDVKITTRYDVNLFVGDYATLIRSGTDFTSIFSPIVEDGKITINAIKFVDALSKKYPGSQVGVDFTTNDFTKDLFQLEISAPLAGSSRCTFMLAMPFVTGVRFDIDGVVL